MNLLNPTPEEVEAEYVKAITELETLKKKLSNRLLAKQLGIEVTKHIDNEGEEE